MFASTIKENKFKIKLEYLKKMGKKKKNSNMLEFWSFLTLRTLLEIVVAGSL